MLIRQNKERSIILKFYLIINTLGGGGAERVITNLAKYFYSLGNDVTLIASYKYKSEYIIPSRIRKYYLDGESLNNHKITRNIFRIIKMRKIIKHDHPDILISFLRSSNFRTLIACMGLKTKCIVSVRNDPKIDYTGLFNFIIVNYVLPHADGCVFQTHEAKSFFPQKLQKKSTVLFNTVKEDFFNINRVPEPFKLVTCGRLERQKNTIMQVEAVSKLLPKYPQIKLEIYGEGSMKDEIQERINELGCSENVFLMGRTDDVESVLSAADIFILSSDYEGMPNALMEALAAGVPCISTDCPCGGPRELINDGYNGLLVPVGSSDELANKIELLLENSILKDILGKNAKIKANEFRPDEIFNQWKKYCEDVLSRG